MVADHTNTAKIKALEDQVHNLLLQVNSHDTQLKGIIEVQTKGVDTSADHTTKIIAIEQLLVLVDLKEVRNAIAAIKETIVALKKDVETNAKWQEEEKKRNETWGHRLWMIVPPALAVAAAYLHGRLK